MKKLFFVALATLALAGCNHKQSQLDFSDVAGKAVIQGYVYVDRGYKQDGNMYVAVNEAAEGCAVVVKVPYSKYDADAAVGNKMFEGICDANGFYSIEIPVGQAAISGASVYTRPFVGKYYEMVNGTVMETEASFSEKSTSVDIENGKTYMAANMVVTKDVTAPNFSRQQVVTVSGQIAQRYEKKTYIDKEDPEKGYMVSADVQNATSAVQLTIKFNYQSEVLMYNVTTDETGAYTLTANLYDKWDIENVFVNVKAKSYLGTMTHYYKKYDEDEKKFIDRSQQVEGYFENLETSEFLTDGDKLIGHHMSKLVLTFVPNYATQTIYGIGNSDIDMKDGKTIYTSSNVLSWYY